MDSTPKDITTLLKLVKENPASQRNQQYKDLLFRRVQGRLREIAGGRLRRERRDQMLQTTMLVDDAFLKLIDGGTIEWQNQEHFFCAASRVIRQILVNHARKNLSIKRGAGCRPLPLDQGASVVDLTSRKPGDLLALNEVVDRLEALRPNAFKVFDLHFFFGLEFQEIADMLGVHRHTVERQWRAAQKFLQREWGTTDVK